MAPFIYFGLVLVLLAHALQSVDEVVSQGFSTGSLVLLDMKSREKSTRDPLVRCFAKGQEGQEVGTCRCQADFLLFLLAKHTIPWLLGKHNPLLVLGSLLWFSLAIPLAPMAATYESQMFPKQGLAFDWLNTFNQSTFKFYFINVVTENKSHWRLYLQKSLCCCEKKE